MSSMQARRMARELQLLSSSPPPGVAAWPGGGSSGQDARMDELEAEIVGAPDTPYAGGVFRLRVVIPPEYPIKPPGVRFVTKIYHPNIDAQGRICLDTLNMPPKGAWKPSLNVATVLASVQLLMSHPNPDDGLMADITEEYRRFPARFHSTASEWTRKFAHEPALHAKCPASSSGPGPCSQRPAVDDHPSATCSNPSDGGLRLAAGRNDEKTKRSNGDASESRFGVVAEAIVIARGASAANEEPPKPSSTSMEDGRRDLVTVIPDSSDEEDAVHPSRKRKHPNNGLGSSSVEGTEQGGQESDSAAGVSRSSIGRDVARMTRRRLDLTRHSSSAGSETPTCQRNTVSAAAANDLSSRTELPETNTRGPPLAEKPSGGIDAPDTGARLSRTRVSAVSSLASAASKGLPPGRRENVDDVIDVDAEDAGETRTPTMVTRSADRGRDTLPGKHTPQPASQTGPAASATRPRVSRLGRSTRLKRSRS